LVAAHADLSRTQAATLIATGHVTVDGRREKASYRPSTGQRIVVDVPPPPGREAVPEAIPLRVVYEDESLLVVDKQAGMVVHPAPGHWRGTLVNALLGRAAFSQAAPGGALPEPSPERAGIVHRLDKNTSGLLLVAKTDRAHRLLSAAIARREVRRLYAALASGHLTADRVTVDRPIARHPRDRKRMAIVSTGRLARTDFVRLARYDAADLLRARLYTGRTHQIRVHLASLGHPIVGDDTYGDGGARHLAGMPASRHFLHAAWLTLRHPDTGALLDLRSPLPSDLRAVLNAVAGVGEAADGGAAEGVDSTGDVLEHVGFYRLDD
jgi:23S rRNA pseudouridine1911/1915/1917 synthase